MRLAIVRQRYTPFGGAERFIEGALEALLERDVAITLYTREWPQTQLQLMEPHVVDPFYIGSLWRDWGFARAACREIGRARLNLVQSHERMLCCDIFRAGDGVHAVWLEERLKHASALERLSVAINPHHRYLLGIERKLFASPWLAAVICNSRMVHDEIRDRFKYPETKLHVVYNAVDATVFSPALKEHRASLRERFRIAADAPVFLLVGSGYRRKGVAAAIRALAELPAPAHLLVVGRDRHLKRYATLARGLGLSGRVTLAGPQSDPRPFFGAADAFVLPTLYDPFPNAALEAMACGLPVITSTKSGAAELVLEHDAGLVCPSDDLAGLIAHMRALLDPTLCEHLGTHARRAVEPLTPAAMTLQLVLLYRELLASSVARLKSTRSRQRFAAAAAGAQRTVAPTSTTTPTSAAAPEEGDAPELPSSDPAEGLPLGSMSPPSAPDADGMTRDASAERPPGKR